MCNFNINKTLSVTIAQAPAADEEFDASMADLIELFGNLSISAKDTIDTPNDASVKQAIVPANQHGDQTNTLAAKEENSTSVVPTQVSSPESIATALAVIAAAEKIEADMMNTLAELYNVQLANDDEFQASMEELVEKFNRHSLNCNEMEVDDENEQWVASMNELISLFHRQSLVCNAMEEDKDEMEIDLAEDDENKTDNDVKMELYDDDDIEMEVLF